MNTQTQEALKMAIETLEMSNDLIGYGLTDFTKYNLKTDSDVYAKLISTINTCKEALESQEQDSLRWANAVIDAYKDGYIAGKNTAPSWQGLSDDEIFSLCTYIDHDLLEEAFYRGARAAEQALKEKNHD